VSGVSRAKPQCSPISCRSASGAQKILLTFCSNFAQISRKFHENSGKFRNFSGKIELEIVGFLLTNGHFESRTQFFLRQWLNLDVIDIKKRSRIFFWEVPKWQKIIGGQNGPIQSKGCS
jgi:hypothetical protein